MVQLRPNDLLTNKRANSPHPNACAAEFATSLMGTDKRILSDVLVVLKNKDSRANYFEAMRRVRALAEVDGKEREMEFFD
jgi:hypothetical protein